MKFSTKIVVVCISLVLASCATTRPRYPELKLPPDRISLNGYSVLPIDETGWLLVGKDEYRFGLAKLGNDMDESFAIQSSITRLDAFTTSAEFEQMIKDGQAKDSNPQRFKLLKHEVSSFPMGKNICAKSHMIAEDNAPTKRSGRSGDMILEALTLSCVHPNENRVAIHITYSHRHYPGQEDKNFAEKGLRLLNSVELFEPARPYLSGSSKPVSELGQKFSQSCSKIIGQALPSHDDNKQESNGDDLGKLSSLGVSIERESSGNQRGSYALFEKGQDNLYTLIAIQATYIEPKAPEKQEVLFVSEGLDRIAPAFAKQVYVESKQAFRCSSGSSNVTGIDSSFRSSYNPCDSSLTSASNIGSSAVANTLLTVLSLGTNLVSGSSVSFVDTDKDKVAKLVVNSKLLQCLKESKQEGLALNKL